ncbi:Family of serine hydrolases 3 [Stygiomarasmius scandens]|uniref:Family of serine hydrolases 3 n=1 Tax=Marasmiellus scandens TaxID=2682957 RepID=A0ABR1JGD3_9AGAR
MSAASSTRRVLVLHGFTQNANIFSNRLGALRKQAKGVEMVFLDAPHILELADVPGDFYAIGGPPRSTDPASTPRAWWRWNTDSLKAIGLQDTLAYLRDRLSAERFDGVMGFSQGAALAALLSALLERPESYPPFLVDGEPPHPPFKFCIAVSGFKLLDPLSHEIFGSGYATPTLHILGKTDVVVSEERSKTLLEISLNKRLEEHEGGHFVPSKNNWRTFVAEYLRSGPRADILSPSLIKAGDSTPSSLAPSGRATPVPVNPLQQVAASSTDIDPKDSNLVASL